MSVWSEQEDNADFSTFHRAKEQYDRGKELGIQDPVRFVSTNEDTYYYALGNMPPADHGHRGFLMGEPARHNADGKPVYYGFLHSDGKHYACALMTVEQFKGIQRPMLDYNGQCLNLGDAIKNIESGWHGIIQSTEGNGKDLMLVCFGVNWWTGDIDNDDKQWHSPFDVIKVDRQPDQSQAPNPLNFL